MGDSTLSGGGTTPPTGAWATLIALFLSIVLIITILLIVPDPRVAIALAVLALFAAVASVGWLFAPPGRRGPRSLIPVLLRAALELLSPPVGGGAADGFGS